MERKYKVGFLMGRFQPFHKGHMYSVTEALKLCDKLYIGIGSVQESGTEKNPLGVEARQEIIEAAIAGEGIDKSRIKIIPIPDFPSDDDWFKYLKGQCPNLDVMFTDNPWCIGICKKEGVGVETPLLDRDSISATNMRKLILSDGDWRSFVPTWADTVEKHIPEIKAALSKSKKQKLPS